MKDVIIYTDGGCRGNPGIGGWAYVLTIDGKKYTGSGADKLTTNNKMELTAVIEALSFVLKNPEWLSYPINIYTDSQYVKNGITKWIHNWIARGWKTANKQPVKNRELWIQLKDNTEKLNVEWNWVKGHSGVDLNEECDQLVNKEMDGLN
ncbi:ribonuclease HI [Spirochaeta cellobiosiphila]|uniref:ribonuclease HI n=1 Tax=Spirochaeta cellobiosiphila TaxID=504483 RepID=UPI0004206E7C|nr:ribonuclease HI [Spirochaeta cellobiosiphila]